MYEPCHNPGVPAGGRQSPERRLYPAGATLRFSCASGRALLGEGSLRCLPGSLHDDGWGPVGWQERVEGNRELFSNYSCLTR